MKRGVASPMVKAPPRHLTTSFRCALFQIDIGDFELTLVQSQRISRELPWTRQAERPRIHRPASRLEEAAGSYRPC